MRIVPHHARRPMTDLGYFHGEVIVGGEGWQRQASYHFPDAIWLVSGEDGKLSEAAMVGALWWARVDETRHHEDEVADAITGRVLASLPSDTPADVRRAIRATALEAYNKGISDSRMAISDYADVVRLSDVVLKGESPPYPDLSPDEFREMCEREGAAVPADFFPDGETKPKLRVV